MIERPQWYVYSFQNAALAPGASQLNKEIQTDSDAPFRMTGIAIYVFSNTGAPLGAAGNLGVTLRWTKADRTWLQRHLISCQTLNPFDGQAINGAGGQQAPYYSYFAPLGMNLFYPVGSPIVIDFQELTAVEDALVLIVFMGTKLYPNGSVWWPTRSYKNPSRPYFGYTVQFDASLLPLFDVPFNISPDADFAWEYGAQTSQAPTPNLSPVGAARNIGVKVKDWTGKYYMNDFIPLDLLFGFNNSQTPGLIYPEIYIPKNQALYLDLKGLP